MMKVKVIQETSGTWMILDVKQHQETKTMNKNC
jgi:hypothetical protein